MIDFAEISKGYGEQQLLDAVSFRINPGDRIGVVGPNGAGKSTLFGIITGELSPDRGKVTLPKGQRIGYLHQQLPDYSPGQTLLDFTADSMPELRRIGEELHELEQRLHEGGVTDTETLLKRHGELQTQFEHLGGYHMRSDAESALCGLGFATTDFERPLKSFSGGWQMRSMLARTLIARPDILLLDEPSNYLDIPAVEWLCRFLNGFRGTMLLISHDRFLLNKLTDITLEINAGQVTRYPGNYDFYRSERENRRVSLEAAKRNIDRKKKELQRNIDRFRSKSSKASQAQSWQKQLDRIQDVVVPDELSYSGSIRLPEPPPCGAEAARLEQVTFAYPGKEPTIVDTTLQIDHGDKIAIVGYNGTGKSTLLKLLTGRNIPQSGRVVIGHNVVIGYQAQEFADLLEPEQSAYDVVRGAARRDFPLNMIPGVLGSFGFSGDDSHKLCKVLSGGEKIRLCFARIFVNPPNLLVLDEPTTHLDIAAREALQKVLQAYRGSLCLVSHDIEFVRQVATTIVAMRPPTIKKYFGNYDYYLQKTAEENAPAATAGKAAEKENIVFDNSREKRRERAQKRQALAADKRRAEQEVTRLEKQLETLEQEQKAIIAQLSSQASGLDFAELNKKLNGLKLETEQTTARWEQAFEKLEELLALNAQIHQD